MSMLQPSWAEHGVSCLQVTALVLRERVPEQLAGLLAADQPELRAAAVFTLGALVKVLLTAVCWCQQTAHTIVVSVSL